MTLLFYGAQSMAMSYRSVHPGTNAKPRLVWKRGDMLWLRGRCCASSPWLLLNPRLLLPRLPFLQLHLPAVRHDVG